MFVRLHAQPLIILHRFSISTFHFVDFRSICNFIWFEFRFCRIPLLIRYTLFSHFRLFFLFLFFFFIFFLLLLDMHHCRQHTFRTLIEVLWLIFKLKIHNVVCVCVTYIRDLESRLCICNHYEREEKNCCKQASKRIECSCDVDKDEQRRRRRAATTTAKKQPKRCWLSFRQTFELITHSILDLYALYLCILHILAVDRKGEKMKIYEE